MSLKTNQDAINTFNIALEAVKLISLIRHDRIYDKTITYVNEISQYDENYATNDDIDIEHIKLVEYCNSILTYFVELEGEYLDNWSR